MYVVFAGRNPGVYDWWPYCCAQVNGFSGAIYQSFPTRAEAQEAYAQWLSKGLREPYRQHHHPASKHYVVFVKHQLGVYDSWPECHVQVNGYHGSLYKSYPNENATQVAYRQWQCGKSPSQTLATPTMPHDYNSTSGNTWWQRVNNSIEHNDGAIEHRAFAGEEDWLHGFTTGLAAALLATIMKLDAGIRRINCNLASTHNQCACIHKGLCIATSLLPI